MQNKEEMCAQFQQNQHFSSQKKLTGEPPHWGQITITWVHHAALSKTRFSSDCICRILES